jgi:hypothetical protein
LSIPKERCAVSRWLSRFWSSVLTRKSCRPQRSTHDTPARRSVPAAGPSGRGLRHALRTLRKSRAFTTGPWHQLLRASAARAPPCPTGAALVYHSSLEFDLARAHPQTAASGPPARSDAGA